MSIMLCMIHRIHLNLYIIFLDFRQKNVLLISFVFSQKGQPLCINSPAQACDTIILKEPLLFQQHHTHSLCSNYTAEIQWKRSNIHFQISSRLLQQADVQGTYFAEHGPYDAWPVALQQALLIDRVMTNQVFHHQQEGSNAVSL